MSEAPSSLNQSTSTEDRTAQVVAEAATVKAIAGGAPDARYTHGPAVRLIAIRDRYSAKDDLFPPDSQEYRNLTAEIERLTRAEQAASLGRLRDYLALYPAELEQRLDTTWTQDRTDPEIRILQDALVLSDIGNGKPARGIFRGNSHHLDIILSDFVGEDGRIIAGFETQYARLVDFRDFLQTREQRARLADAPTAEQSLQAGPTAPISVASEVTAVRPPAAPDPGNEPEARVPLVTSELPGSFTGVAVEVSAPDFDSKGRPVLDEEHDRRMILLTKRFGELRPRETYVLIKNISSKAIEITGGGSILRTTTGAIPDEYSFQATFTREEAQNFLHDLHLGGKTAADALRLLEAIKQEEENAEGNIPEFTVDSIGVDMKRKNRVDLAAQKFINDFLDINWTKRVKIMRDEAPTDPTSATGFTRRTRDRSVIDPQDVTFVTAPPAASVTEDLVEAKAALRATAEAERDRLREIKVPETKQELQGWRVEIARALQDTSAVMFRYGEGASLIRIPQDGKLEFAAAENILLSRDLVEPLLSNSAASPIQIVTDLGNVFSITPDQLGGKIFVSSRADKHLIEIGYAEGNTPYSWRMQFNSEDSYRSMLAYLAASPNMAVALLNQRFDDSFGLDGNPTPGLPKGLLNNKNILKMGSVDPLGELPVKVAKEDVELDVYGWSQQKAAEKQPALPAKGTPDLSEALFNKLTQKLKGVELGPGTTAILTDLMRGIATFMPPADHKTIIKNVERGIKRVDVSDRSPDALVVIDSTNIRFEIVEITDDNRGTFMIKTSENSEYPLRVFLDRFKLITPESIREVATEE